MTLINFQQRILPYFLGFIFIWLLPTVANTQEIQVHSQLCEYQTNPIGIDTQLPRLSWKLSAKKRNQMQSAYEIIVSKDERIINRKKGDVWSSGKIQSDQSVQIEYGGKPLEPFTRYYWRVRVADQNGKFSKWSAVNSFETAFLGNTKWDMPWISDGSKTFTKEEDFYKEDPNPLFRKGFRTSSKIKSARLYISGLGYYEAFINGDKIGDRKLEPGWTAYDKEVLYAVYDVQAHIRKGDNMIGIMLGNGWYNLLPMRFWGAHNWRNTLVSGRPKVSALLRIVYDNGKVDLIKTDNQWETSSGPILKNNIYLGEHVDGRLIKEDWAMPHSQSLTWKAAEITDHPPGAMRPQQQPPIRITKELKPVAVKEVEPGVFVFDMGQNFAGVARIKVQGPSGTKVQLRYGEDVYPDGKINVMTSVAGQIKAGNGGPGAPPIAWQEDSYILKGDNKPEIWEPRFTFHGFRYVEVRGWPGTPTLNDLVGLRMNADLPDAGHFNSSNKLFNKIDHLIQWTFLSNVFSVVSDCPAREKLAYGGDILCASETFMYNYDMAQFYTKTIRDHALDQRPLGGITETAPFVGIADAGPGDGSGPMGFQAGFSYLIKKMYEFYADKRLLMDYYPALKKQADFLISKADHHLFDTDLGDHESLDTKNPHLTASVFYYFHIHQMHEFANLLGNTEDARRYEAQAQIIKNAILQKFYNPKNGQVASGTQSDQLFALWADLLANEQKEKGLQQLDQAFQSKDWHVATGIFGTKMMFEVLRKQEENEKLYKIANQETYPGWGHMVNNGATTVWETWKYSDNTYSHNHPMFGSIGEWFYRSLLGINAIEPGFKKFRIQPQLVKDLKHAEGDFQSLHGVISSAWKNDEDEYLLNVQIPVNTKAEVWIFNPQNQQVKENNKMIDVNSKLYTIRRSNNYTIVEVGSGAYSFAIKHKQQI